MLRFIGVLIISFFAVSAHAESPLLDRQDIESLRASVGSLKASGGNRFCTAFLVHPQILAGISHCQFNGRFVYFEAGSKKDSYRIRRIFGINNDGIALYFIEKPVLNRPILKFSSLTEDAKFPIVAMGYPSDWPNENSYKEDLAEIKFKASWSPGAAIVESGLDFTSNKLAQKNGAVLNISTNVLRADIPYISGSAMSGGPVIDSTGVVVGIHTSAGGVFYSSKDALETLHTMREFLKNGGDLHRVITLPAEGRKTPAMRLSLVDNLGIDYAPDQLTIEMLDYILSNAVD